MNKKGLLAISPFLFFLIFYIGSSIIAGDFNKTPIIVAFLFSSVYALLLLKGTSITDRIDIFTKGAGKSTVIFMILIFVVAGAFASSAKAMGCVSETVNLILTLLPAKYIYASLFLAGCFLSLGTGSGIGTIVALCPIAVGVAQQVDANMAMMCAIVICGAMFGDNLSFISDTTIVATSSQGCKLSDKFKTNFLIVVPAALIVFVIYMYLGNQTEPVAVQQSLNYFKILPYLFVIILSILGMNVIVVLLIGSVLCGIMGCLMGDFDFYGWMAAAAKGIDEMSPFITVILLASGLIEIIRYKGGIDYMVSLCTKIVRGRRSAELCICLLTGVVCACTANNTVAIISIGDVVHKLSSKFNVDPRKAASLLDTSSCIVQELLPYSTHLLAAAAFGAVSTLEMLPYVFYAYFLILCVTISIIFGIPALKKHNTSSSK